MLTCLVFYVCQIVIMFWDYFDRTPTSGFSQPCPDNKEIEKKTYSASPAQSTLYLNTVLHKQLLFVVPIWLPSMVMGDCNFLEEMLLIILRTILQS